MKKIMVAGMLILGDGAVCLAENHGPEPVDLRIVTILDRFEPFGAHLFHAGNLWVGRSRKDLGANYRLEVYDGNGALVAEQQFGHSLRYITPFGADAVLVIGIATDQLSHYSVVRLQEGQLTVAQTDLPLDAFADRFVGSDKHMIFTDPGGFDDPDHPTPPSEPLQTVFTMRGSQVHWLKPRFSMPQQGFTVGDRLYVLTSPGIGAGNRFFRVIDLETEETRLLSGKLADAPQMVQLEGRPEFAIADRGRKEVLIFDPRREEFTRTIDVGADGIRPLTSYGRCVAVGLEHERKILFYTLDGGQLVAAWDISPLGEEFFGLRELASDRETGRIFGRANYPCNPTDPACGPKRNGVMMATPTEGSQAVSACLR